MTTPKWSVPYLSDSLLRDGAAPPGGRGPAAEDMVRPEGAAPPGTSVASTGSVAPAVDPQEAARRVPVLRGPAAAPDGSTWPQGPRRLLVTPHPGLQARRRVRAAGHLDVRLAAFVFIQPVEQFGRLSGYTGRARYCAHMCSKRR